MSAKNIELSVVLPAYEEADNLRNLLPHLRQIASQLTPDFEILVVDTREPKDATPEICKQWNIQYMPRSGGDTYGQAVRTGIQRSLGKYVILMDADGSHNPSFLPKLWEHRESTDLVIASRYIKGGSTQNPAILIFLSLTVNVVFRIVLGLRCFDVSNSFRLYQGDDLRALDLRCENFDIVEEILVLLTVRNPDYRITEIPFTFEERKAGKTKRHLVAFALSYLAVLIKLLNLRRKARKSDNIG